MTITNPTIDSLLDNFIGDINANPNTSNYIFDEDDHNITKFKQALEQYIAREVLEGRIEELHEIYGIDPAQLENYLRDRLATLQSKKEGK